MSYLYSIGYATKPVAVFIQQLRDYEISAIADVRSVPYSKIFHDYHREALAATLKRNRIAYVYLGEELGPRSKDDAHYNAQQQVQFDRLMKSSLYQEGVKRLQTGLGKGMNIAMMCAEKDPADCHRSLLIAYSLKRELGIEVQHINHQGMLESQVDLELRMCKLHNLGNDLFLSGDEQLTMAWQIQCLKKAYKREGNENS